MRHSSRTKKTNLRKTDHIWYKPINTVIFQNITH